MSVDPETIDEARSWFARAMIDLRAGALEIGAAPTLNTDIVFHAQQAAEKSIKGFLCYHEKAFRKTHNLVELGEACVSIDPQLEPLLKRAAVLTEYAWRYRYPGDDEDPDDREAVTALNLAQEVYEALVSVLPKKD
jgi:HEPN domain-containing protein